MGGHSTDFSDDYPICSVVSPPDELYFVPKSTLNMSHYIPQDLHFLGTKTRRPSNAPPPSPVLSPEHTSKSLLCHQADLLSSRNCSLSYLEQQLGNIQPQQYQGETLDLGCEQARRRFSFEDKPFDNEDCNYIHGCRCHCSSHDDDSTMVDLSSRAQSLCSEADTILEETSSKDRTLSCYTAPKASLSYDYPELYPSNPDSLIYTMPSPTPSTNNVESPPLKPYLEARRSYGLFGSPPVVARSRQISLPIINMPNVNPKINPQMASSRAQSWHASPVYSPGRKPPKPPPEIEKSIFEDYDEDNVEEKKLSNRFRHLIRRLHCG